MNIKSIAYQYICRLLGFNLVPRDVYEEQDAFYPTRKEDYGVSVHGRLV